MPGKNYKCESLEEKEQQEILALYQQGYGYNYIENWLKDKGFVINRKQLQNWIDYKLEGKRVLQNDAEKSENYNNKIKRDTTANPIIDKPEDLEMIRNSWAVPDNKSLDINPELAIGASQKMAYDLFMSVGILTKNRLNLYQQGQAKFPEEQIKALKLLYDMYAPLLGVSEMINPNAAIKSLELAGYDVSNINNAATKNEP